MIFELLLSAGAFETDGAWQNELNGMFAFYNGNNMERTFWVETDDAKLRIVYGNATGILSDGRLRAEVPPGTLAVFIPENGTARGVEKNGIIYSAPKEGGRIICESDAVAAQYSTYNGNPELIRLYINGDIVLDGEGEIRFFRWDAMQPK